MRANLDPHLTFAHGGRADFKGEDNTWYAMLSARNVTLNMLFVRDDFRNRYRLVHGSAMKSAAWVIRTNRTGTIVTIEYNASATTGTRAMVRTATEPPRTDVLRHGSKPWRLENVRIELRERKLEGSAKRTSHGIALVVLVEDRWVLSVWSQPYPNAVANPGKALLNTQVEALYDADADIVAPHGLVGQSYDGDDAPLNGKLDDYSGAEVTTTAQAEGAIEGVAADYRMRHKFATRFKYSRFDATIAKHRNVGAILDGQTLPTEANVTTPARSVSAVADLDESDNEAGRDASMPDRTRRRRAA